MHVKLPSVTLKFTRSGTAGAGVVTGATVVVTGVGGVVGANVVVTGVGGVVGAKVVVLFGLTVVTFSALHATTRTAYYKYH